MKNTQRVLVGGSISSEQHPVPLTYIRCGPISSVSIEKDKSKYKSIELVTRNYKETLVQNPNIWSNADVIIITRAVTHQIEIPSYKSKYHLHLMQTQER